MTGELSPPELGINLCEAKASYDHDVSEPKCALWNCDVECYLLGLPKLPPSAGPSGPPAAYAITGRSAARRPTPAAETAGETQNLHYG
jgi:hypothetical protein